MSDRLFPISWQHKEKIYEILGYEFWKQDGTHRSYVLKEIKGALTEEEIRKIQIDINSPERPPIIVLIQKSEIPVATLQLNKRKLRLSSREFRNLIKETE